MIQLPTSSRVWSEESFARTLKQELENLPQGSLPLARATTQGGYVDDANICCSILSFESRGTTIRAKVGVFFTEIVIGCGCGDDPFEQNAYCEMMVEIDKHTASANTRII